MEIIRQVTVSSDKLYGDNTPDFTQDANATAEVQHLTGLGVSVYVPDVTHSDNYMGYHVTQNRHNFYYRVLIEPNNLALGLLTTSTSQTITAWNGYDNPVSIVSIEGMNTVGFTLTPPGALPYSIPMHKTVDLQLTSNSSVAATTDGMFKIRFSNGDEMLIYITATSMVLFDIPPNWSEEFVETFKFKTDVLTAWDGTEQRRKLRSKPRFEINYSGLLRGDSLTLIQSVLHNWQNKTFALPHWLDSSDLKVDTPIGSLSFVVDTRFKSFDVSEYVYIESPTGEGETLGISSVGLDVIAIKTQTSKYFPAGSKIYPVLNMLIGDTVDYSMKTDNTGIIDVSFQADTLTQRVDMHSGDNPVSTTYDNYEVYPFKHNWNTDVKIQSVSNTNVVDFELVKRIVEKGVTLNILHIETLLRSRSDINKFKAFIDRRSGRHTAFMLPTDLSSFTLTEDYTTNNPIIMFKNNGISTHLNNKQPYVRIKLKNGNVYFRRIMMFRENSPLVAVGTLDSVIPETFTPNQVAKITECKIVRLASDDIVIRYTSDTVAKVGLKLQEVIR